MDVQPVSGMEAASRSGSGKRGFGFRIAGSLVLLLCTAAASGFWLSPLQSRYFPVTATVSSPAVGASQSESALSGAAVSRAPLQASPGENANPPLRLMTFNIRHAKGLDGQIRLSAISSQIERGRADVVALQEVDRYQWRSGLQDQAAALARQLGMQYIFAPAMKQGLSQYGIALLSRYPLSRVRIDRLPGGLEPRVALAAQTVTARGEAVTIITTHLGVPHADRTQQMPELLRFVRSVQTPVVVMGDFNMKESDPLMGELSLLLHKVPLARPQATVLHGGEIDHLFAGFEDKASAWTEATAASDHRPVLATVFIH